ncbi:hypothetical protein [Ornithinimicrobium kibberense]
MRIAAWSDATRRQRHGRTLRDDSGKVVRRRASSLSVRRRSVCML